MICPVILVFHLLRLSIDCCLKRRSKMTNWILAVNLRVLTVLTRRGSLVLFVLVSVSASDRGNMKSFLRSLERVVCCGSRRSGIAGIVFQYPVWGNESKLFKENDHPPLQLIDLYWGSQIFKSSGLLLHSIDLKERHLEIATRILAWQVVMVPQFLAERHRNALFYMFCWCFFCIFFQKSTLKLRILWEFPR